VHVETGNPEFFRELLRATLDTRKNQARTLEKIKMGRRSGLESVEQGTFPDNQGQILWRWQLWWGESSFCGQLLRLGETIQVAA